MKRFERSNGLDTALYKNYFFFTRLTINPHCLVYLYSNIVIVIYALFNTAIYVSKVNYIYNNYDGSKSHA